MTALTQQQWYDKIKTLVPQWMWQKEVTIRAWAMALSKIAEAQQGKVQEHLDAAYIMRSTAGELDSHGTERSTPRLDNELDSDYAVRVQNLFNQSSVPALNALIDKVLVAGTCRIQEDFNSIPFCDSGSYASRACIFLTDPLVNTFSIVVDKQTHAPYSYIDRAYFCDRESFAGTDVSLDRVFNSILKIGNDSKALGTFFRIYELLE